MSSEEESVAVYVHIILELERQWKMNSGKKRHILSSFVMHALTLESNATRTGERSAIPLKSKPSHGFGSRCNGGEFGQVYDSRKPPVRTLHDQLRIAFVVSHIIPWIFLFVLFVLFRVAPAECERALAEVYGLQLGQV